MQKFKNILMRTKVNATLAIIFMLALFGCSQKPEVKHEVIKPTITLPDPIIIINDTNYTVEEINVSIVEVVDTNISEEQ